MKPMQKGFLTRYAQIGSITVERDFNKISLADQTAQVTHLSLKSGHNRWIEYCKSWIHTQQNTFK